jgi:hypothetical protein
MAFPYVLLVNFKGFSIAKTGEDTFLEGAELANICKAKGFLGYLF